MKQDHNQKAFFELLKVGLWVDAESADIRRRDFAESVDWNTVYQLASEQSVVGVVLAGLEHSDVKPPQEFLLQWIGEVMVIEQQNKSMNEFVAKLIERLRQESICSLLIKGQGIAQCYEHPLWRTSGDVDLLLSEDNYQRAIEYLSPLVSDVKKEYQYKKHQAMTIESWVVELHGSLRGGLSSQIDGVLDEVQKDVFCNGNVRSWMNGRSQILLPGVDCDVVFVFSHLLKHFYKEGLGLRQVCDWCRLLWTYRDKLDVALLERRLREMSLLSEWKVFAAFAVKYLGMPVEAMPLFNENDNKAHDLHRKAEMIKDFVLEVGNMGHNRDMSYFEKYPYHIRKMYSMGRRCADMIRHARIFPLDSMRFFPRIMINGLRSAARGE